MAWHGMAWQGILFGFESGMFCILLLRAFAFASALLCLTVLCFYCGVGHFTALYCALLCFGALYFAIVYFASLRF